jgi:uncharacterized membrane protein YqjE
MILTKKFEISKKEYFNVILRRLIQKQWFTFGVMWLLAFVFLFDDNRDYFQNFIIIFSILYPIIIVFSYWRFTNAKDNSIIFVEREHEIHNDKLVSRMSNGSESSIQIDSFVKAIEVNNIYLLYVNKTNSVYFPKRVFKTMDDEVWFKNNFFLKIKSKEL